MFRKKEVEQENNFLTPDATDYTKYDFSLKDKIMWFTVGSILAFIVAYIFYASIIVSGIAALVGGYFFLPIRNNQIISKRKMKLQLQFKDLLESLATSIGAGRNMSDSFINSREDLVVVHSENSDIIRELDIIIYGMRNGFTIEDLLLDFGLRCKLPDVVDFADVFQTCYRKGGNIKSVIDKTEKVIHEKMEITMDIETMITEKKTEQNGLMVMPIIFVFIMRSMGGSMVDLNSPVGMLASTVAIGFFVISFFVSKKILNIKL